MQTQKVERENNNAQSNRFSKRIGSTVYSVNVYFKEGGKETLEEKMWRMMQSDLNSGQFHGRIAMPQCGKCLASKPPLPERSSI